MATVTTVTQLSIPKFNQGAFGDTFLVDDGTYDHPSFEYLSKSGISVQAKNKHKAIIKGAPIGVSGADIKFKGFDLTFKTTAQTVTPINGARCDYSDNKIHHVNAITSRQDWHVVKGQDTKFERNDVYGKVGLGNPLLIGTGSAVVKGVKVRDNHLHDMKGGTGNGAEMIRVGSSEVSSIDFFCEIAGNTVENHDTSDTELFTIKTSSNDIHDNIIKNCKATLTLRHGRKNKVRNNKFFGGGLRLYGEGHEVTGNEFKLNSLNQLRQIVIGNGQYKTEEDFKNRPSGAAATYTQVRDLLFENNTIEMADSTDDIILCLGYGSYSLKPTNNKFINNKISASNGTLANTRDGASWTGNTVQNNILYPTGSAKAGDMPKTGYIIKDWTQQAPSPPEPLPPQPGPEPAPEPPVSNLSIEERLTALEAEMKAIKDRVAKLEAV